MIKTIIMGLIIMSAIATTMILNTEPVYSQQGPTDNSTLAGIPPIDFGFIEPDNTTAAQQHCIGCKPLGPLDYAPQSEGLPVPQPPVIQEEEVASDGGDDESSEGNEESGGEEEESSGDEESGGGE